MRISGSDSPTATKQILKILIAREIRVKIVSNVLSIIFNSTLRLSDIVGSSSKRSVLNYIVSMVLLYIAMMINARA